MRTAARKAIADADAPPRSHRACRAHGRPSPRRRRDRPRGRRIAPTASRRRRAAMSRPGWRGQRRGPWDADAGAARRRSRARSARRSRRRCRRRAPVEASRSISEAQPVTASLASVSRLTISSARPVRSFTRSRNSAPFAADAAGFGGDRAASGRRRARFSLSAQTCRASMRAMHGGLRQAAGGGQALAEPDDAREGVDDLETAARGLGDEQAAVVRAEIEGGIDRRVASRGLTASRAIFCVAIASGLPLPIAGPIRRLAQRAGPAVITARPLHFPTPEPGPSRRPLVPGLAPLPIRRLLDSR